MTTAFASACSRTHNAASTSGGMRFRTDAEFKLLRRMFSSSLTPMTIRLATAAPPSTVARPLGLILRNAINREDQFASGAAEFTQADPFQTSHPARTPDSAHTANDAPLCKPMCLTGPDAPAPCIHRQLAAITLAATGSQIAPTTRPVFF